MCTFKVTLGWTLLAALAAITQLAHAGDDANNPLHPNYFASRSTVGVWKGARATDSQPYTDVRNPLHPAYKQDAAPRVWESTEILQTGLYRDQRNPLWPGYGVK